MAAVNFSPSGFSYAQAARGRTSAATSQTSSSKVTSGTATPSTCTLSEPTGSNWADDVEATVEDKSSGAQKAQPEESKSSQFNDSVTERAQSEPKVSEGGSITPSPDLPASPSTTSKENETSSMPNGTSSDSTWETKSQASEPAWIADRKERQNSTQPSEKPSKGEKKNKEAATPTPPKPVILQDAPLPTFNPWQRRAEEAKAKMAALPSPTQSTQTSASPANLKENQPPRAEPRRKANSLTNIPRESLPGAGDETRKPSSFHGKRTNDVRNSTSRQNSKVAADDSRSDTPQASSTKAAPTERQSDSVLSAPPPSVKDEVSWPTPDNVHEKDRKEAAEKDTDEKPDEDTPTTKRKKPEWKVMPVVPNVIWETPSSEMKGSKPRGPPGADRTSRGGNAGRGRGGHRGTTSGTGGEHQTSRSNSVPIHQESESSSAQRGVSNTVERDTMAPPPRPSRASSAGPRGEQNEQKKESLERTMSGKSITETVSSINGTVVSTNATPSHTGHTKPVSEDRRSKSPKKRNTASSGYKDEEYLPKPIPRRSSVGTQTEDVTEGTESNARDGPPIRMVPSESRKEPRNSDTARDPAWAPPRGGKRGGRGRGGNGGRELTNGHPAAHPYGNGLPPDFSTATTYAVPASPSPYQDRRGNHQFAYPPPGRGGWRGNPRSQSIPLEHFYNQRFPGAFGGSPQHVANIQTYPGMYDMNGYPMSAIPFSPHLESQQLMGLVSMQLEYYFSMDNLLKDMFLRKHMDSQGFVFLEVIANFNRIKQLTQDKDLIKMVCMNSDSIEIRVGEDGKDRLRKREGWEQFLLPMEQREQSAQTKGPDHLQRPERPHLLLNNIPPLYRGPASAGIPHMHQRADRRSYDTAYPTVNGYPAQFAAYHGYPEPTYGGETVNGEEMRGRAAKSPIHESVMPSPSEQTLVGTPEISDTEPDKFPDDEAAILTVVIRTSEQRPPYQYAASRTFSNGSIDSRSILTEMQKPAELKPQQSPNGESFVNGSDGRLSLSRQVSANRLLPDERTPGGTGLPVMWVKDQDFPRDNLPHDTMSVQYQDLWQKAMDQRNQAATGNCPYDLEVLYQFWSHFLIRNFNNRMYSEFKYFAHEDAKEGHNMTGMHNLLQFYHKSLGSNNPIRDRVIKDYVKLVKEELPKLEGAAFKQLRSAWRDGALNLKSRKKLADMLDDKLKEQLDKGHT